MQFNFWSSPKHLDRHKTFWDLKKDKALVISPGSTFHSVITLGLLLRCGKAVQQRHKFLCQAPIGFQTTLRDGYLPRFRMDVSSSS